ncbi:tautomerase family protein [Streptomyces sp. NBC_01288]|uniref:tautomerase family protein n=1 Tax=Streptomyces sp. NBC_01288 TaxID=2903814 RepID=UPI002E129805|nr:tautomerase family protein [Streptomyces sp. NBC_01288]
MPVYTCTAAQGTLTHESKASLAAEITRIHAAVNHVPPAYVNVIFTEPPSENVFAGGVPGTPLIITGWARRGHPQESTTRLALELSAAAVRVTGVEENHVMVVIQDSPARSAVEGGQVLPEPGEEKEWLAHRGEA